MQIYINRTGQQYGPYSVNDLNEHLRTGAIAANDLAWYEGCPEWIPASNIPGVAAPSRSTPPPPPLPKPGGVLYTDYSQVPYYRKQWFFWVMYFTITPVALGLLVFGDIYYKKRGQVKPFGLANRIVAGIIGVFYVLKVFGALLS